MSQHSRVLLLGHGAPRLARIWAGTVLGEVVPPDGVRRENIAEDVMLCVSELVTDALLANSKSATVRIRVAPGIIRLSVTDDAPRLADARDPVLYAQLIGWGMVRALSQGCGIENYDTGRELWVIFRDTSASPQQLTRSSVLSPADGDRRPPAGAHRVRPAEANALHTTKVYDRSSAFRAVRLAECPPAVE